MDGDAISLRNCPGVISFIDCGDLTGTRFVCDTRLIGSGDVFVALRGRSADGHDHVADAVHAGSIGIVSERPLAGLKNPICVVADSRRAWAWMKMAQFGNPHESLRISGVTGTNGKTTVSWLLRSILQAAGRQTGLAGTVEYSDGRQNHSSELTTPDAGELARLFRQMQNVGTTDCVLEISSHAIDQQRCSGFQLDTAAITSISQDHLDYHGTVEEYRSCKLRIAELLKPGGTLLLNIDDPVCRESLDQLQGVRLQTWGESADADLRILHRQPTDQGQIIQLQSSSAMLEIHTSLFGKHNACNIAAAVGMAMQSGIPEETILRGLHSMRPIPGRMESVTAGQPFHVFVDFAHTPDAIAESIETCRQLTSGRLLLVFGAGGDRDRNKRPGMAKAAEHADKVFVTSDNPRSESPQQIIAEICAGFHRLDHVHQITDRREAIAAAVTSAKAGDVVLICGRGHEDTQYIGTREIAFSDCRISQRLLQDLMAGNNSHAKD